MSLLCRVIVVGRGHRRATLPKVSVLEESAAFCAAHDSELSMNLLHRCTFYWHNYLISRVSLIRTIETLEGGTFRYLCTVLGLIPVLSSLDGLILSNNFGGCIG